MSKDAGGQRQECPIFFKAAEKKKRTVRKLLNIIFFRPLLTSGVIYAIILLRQGKTPIIKNKRRS